jgi:large subunit ribosomal protein L18e
MVKRTGPTNPNMRMLIEVLQRTAREQGVSLWRRIAEDLNKPSRQRRSVNVYKINQYGREGETIIVPGKVLSVGELTKPLEVAAFSFSESALKKINEKGKALTIAELIEKNPKGNNVRIIG